MDPALNLKEYISSGILELYASGKLPKEEAEGVEAMAAKHPEIREELNAIEQSLEIFARGFQQTPPDNLLVNIQDAIARAEAENQSGGVVRPLETKESRFPWRRIAIAAAVALLISLVFNLFQYRDLQETQDELLALSQQQSQMADQLQQTSEQLQSLASPDQIIIDLQGLPISPDSYARVFWQKESQTVYLKVGSLPAPAAGKQYQLWAIVDGVPVDAGVFDPIAEVQQLDQPIQGNVRAFAVTLEPLGGSAKPTLDQMYISGTVG